LLCNTGFEKLPIFQASCNRGSHRWPRGGVLLTLDF
jgi:hypothetical protein